MKKVLFILAAFAALFISCGKTQSGCQPVPVASEKAQLVAYCNTNGINYTEHSSGLLYEIINPGSGANPTSTSTVSVVYTGKLVADNSIFDSRANPVSFSMSGGLIDGWKIALPLIQKGGRIKIVIPSALGYSCTGNPPVIPANAPLFFDVTLSDVK